MADAPGIWDLLRNAANQPDPNENIPAPVVDVAPPPDPAPPTPAGWAASIEALRNTVAQVAELPPSAYDDMPQLINQVGQIATAQGFKWAPSVLAGNAGRNNVGQAIADTDDLVRRFPGLSPKGKKALLGMNIVRQVLNYMPLEPQAEDALVKNAALKVSRDAIDTLAKQGNAGAEVERRAAALNQLAGIPDATFGIWARSRLPVRTVFESHRKANELQIGIGNALNIGEDASPNEVACAQIDELVGNAVPPGKDGTAPHLIVADRMLQDRQAEVAKVLGYTPELARVSPTGNPVTEALWDSTEGAGLETELKSAYLYQLKRDQQLLGEESDAVRAVQVAILAHRRRTNTDNPVPDPIPLARVEPPKADPMVIMQHAIVGPENIPAEQRMDLDPDSILRSKGLAQTVARGFMAFGQSLQAISDAVVQMSGTGRDVLKPAAATSLGEKAGEFVIGRLIGDMKTAERYGQHILSPVQYVFQHILSLNPGTEEVGDAALQEIDFTAFNTKQAYIAATQKFDEETNAANKRLTGYLLTGVREGNPIRDLGRIVVGAIKNAIVDPMAFALDRPTDQIAAFVTNEAFSTKGVQAAMGSHIPILRTWRGSLRARAMINKLVAEGRVNIVEQLTKRLKDIDLGAGVPKVAAKLEHAVALGEAALKVKPADIPGAPVTRAWARAVGAVIPRISSQAEWAETFMHMLDRSGGLFGAKKLTNLLKLTNDRALREGIANLIDPGLTERLVAKGLKPDDVLTGAATRAHALASEISDTADPAKRTVLIEKLRQTIKADSDNPDLVKQVHRLDTLDRLVTLRQLKPDLRKGTPFEAWDDAQMDAVIGNIKGDLVRSMFPTDLDLHTLTRLAELPPARVGSVTRFMNEAYYNVTGRYLFPDAAAMTTKMTGAQRLMRYFSDNATAYGVAQVTNGRRVVARNHFFSYVASRAEQTLDLAASELERVKALAQQIAPGPEKVAAMEDVKAARKVYETARTDRDRVANEWRKAQSTDPEVPWSFLRGAGESLRLVTADDIADLIDTAPELWGSSALEQAREPLWATTTGPQAKGPPQVHKGIVDRLTSLDADIWEARANVELMQLRAKTYTPEALAKWLDAEQPTGRALPLIEDIKKLVQKFPDSADIPEELPRALRRMIDLQVLSRDPTWTPNKHSMVRVIYDDKGYPITVLTDTADTFDALVSKVSLGPNEEALFRAKLQSESEFVYRNTGGDPTKPVVPGKTDYIRISYRKPAGTIQEAGEAVKKSAIEFLKNVTPEIKRAFSKKGGDMAASIPTPTSAEITEAIQRIERIMEVMPAELFATGFTSSPIPIGGPGAQNAWGLCTKAFTANLCQSVFGGTPEDVAATFAHEVGHAFLHTVPSAEDYAKLLRLYHTHMSQLRGRPTLDISVTNALDDLDRSIKSLSLTNVGEEQVKVLLQQLTSGGRISWEGASIGKSDLGITEYYIQFTEWFARHMEEALDKKGLVARRGGSYRLSRGDASAEAIDFINELLAKRHPAAEGLPLTNRSDWRVTHATTASLESVPVSDRDAMAMSATIQMYFDIQGMSGDELKAATKALDVAAAYADHLPIGPKRLEKSAAKLAEAGRAKARLLDQVHSGKLQSAALGPTDATKLARFMEAATRQVGIDDAVRVSVEEAKAMWAAARSAGRLKAPEFNPLTIGALPYWEQLKATRYLGRQMVYATASYAARAEALANALGNMTAEERGIIRNSITKGRLTPAARTLLQNDPELAKALPHLDAPTSIEARARNLDLWVKTESELQSDLIEAARETGLIDQKMYEKMRRAGYVPHVYGLYERPAQVQTKAMKEAKRNMRAGQGANRNVGIQGDELMLQRDLVKWRVRGREADGYIHDVRFTSKRKANDYLRRTFAGLTKDAQDASGTTFKTMAGDTIHLLEPIGDQATILDLLTERAVPAKQGKKTTMVAVPTEHMMAARLEKFAALNRDIHVNAMLSSLRATGLVLSPEEFATKFAGVAGVKGPGADSLAATYVRLPQAQALGNLSGYHVHRQVFAEMNNMRHTFDQVEAWLRGIEEIMVRDGTPPPWDEAGGLLKGMANLDAAVARGVKWAQIIASPATWSANITSNFLFSTVAAGPYLANPRHWPMVWRTMQDIFGAQPIKLPQDILEAIEDGVITASRFDRSTNAALKVAMRDMASLDDTLALTERLNTLQSALGDEGLSAKMRRDLELEVVAVRQALVKKTPEHAKTLSQGLMKMYRAVTSAYLGAEHGDVTGVPRATLPHTMREWYGKVDDFFKMATYRRLREAGAGRAEAAWNVKTFMQDYSNIPTWVQKSGRSALGSLVPSFQYEMTRILWNSIKYRGARLVGIFGAVAAWNSVQEATAGVSPTRELATEDILANRSDLDRVIAKFTRLRMYNPVTKALLFDVDLGNSFFPLTGIFSQPNTLARAAEDMFPEDQPRGTFGSIVAAGLGYAGGYVGGRPMVSMAYSLLHGRDSMTGRPLLENDPRERSTGDYFRAGYHAVLRALIPPVLPGGRAWIDMAEAAARPPHPDTGRPLGGPGVGQVAIRTFTNVNVRGLPAYAVSRLLGGRDKADAVDDRDIVKATLWHVTNLASPGATKDWPLFGDSARKRALIAELQATAEPAEKARLQAQLEESIREEEQLTLYQQKMVDQPGHVAVAKELRAIEERGMPATFRRLAPNYQAFALSLMARAQVNPQTLKTYAEAMTFTETMKWRQTEDPDSVRSAIKILQESVNDSGLTPATRRILSSAADLLEVTEFKALQSAARKGLLE